MTVVGERPRCGDLKVQKRYSRLLSDCNSFNINTLVLRERHHNSNFLWVRIPIEISNSARGEKAIAVAEGPLHYSLPLSPAAITRLQDARLIRLPRPVKTKRLPIDYAVLQQTYHRMLTEGGFSSRAELARHLGVSRVWVSIVLKGIK